MQFNMDALIFGVFLAGMPIRRKITWVCLVVLAAVIKVFSYYPAAVEKYYSRGVYLFTARLQRFLFGWLPFSVGDILYFAAAVIILYRLIRLIRQLVRGGGAE